MSDYKYKYNKYKHKCLKLKSTGCHNYNLNNVIGGSYDMKSRSNMKSKSSVLYNDVANNVINIGKFAIVDNKIIAGESLNLVLEMPKGEYNAYKSNNDLIIVHETNKNKINKEYLEKINFNIVGEIGVDVGKFGFFDFGIAKDNYNKSFFGVTIPFFNLPKDKDYSLISSHMIADYSTETEKHHLANKYQNKVFGVQSYTGIGDGFFTCIMSEEDKIAVLLGHIA